MITKKWEKRGQRKGLRTEPWAPQNLNVSKVKSSVVQSCLTLCDPMDWGLPGSSVHGILQERTLERVVISFSRRYSRPRDRTQVLHCRQTLYDLNHQGSSSKVRRNPKNWVRRIGLKDRKKTRREEYWKPIELIKSAQLYQILLMGQIRCRMRINHWI